MQKLPLVVGQELRIRSKDREYFQIDAKVIGARPNEFIIIDNLILEMNERLFVRLQGDIICNYIYQGKGYLFESRVIDSIGYDMSLIRYPSSVEIQSLRKHTRIRIQLPVILSLPSEDSGTQGVITDISEGGCRLLFDKLFYVTSKMKCRLSFELPDGRPIKGLHSAIRSINVSKLRKTTELGIQFLGPKEVLQKVSAFCEFCRRFKL